MSDHATEWNDLQKVLRHLAPAEKLRLIEEMARSLRAPATDVKPGDHRANLDRLRHELAALPVCNPADDFSNRDHDDELYGEAR